MLKFVHKQCPTTFFFKFNVILFIDSDSYLWRRYDQSFLHYNGEIDNNVYVNNANEFLMRKMLGKWFCYWERKIILIRIGASSRSWNDNMSKRMNIHIPMVFNGDVYSLINLRPLNLDEVY